MTKNILTKLENEGIRFPNLEKWTRNTLQSVVKSGEGVNFNPLDVEFSTLKMNFLANPNTNQTQTKPNLFEIARHSGTCRVCGLVGAPLVIINLHYNE